jgi:Zn-dependent peptidase ImmA (M78 family)/transcriptional regulator with XRE-family HTH domain
MIGERLKLARAAAGLSLRELSAKIDGLVSAQAIGKYERDEMAPTSTVEIALEKALGVTGSFLFRHDALAIEGVEFRKRVLTSAKERAQLTALVLYAAEKYGQLEDILAIDSVWAPPKGFPKSIVSLSDAEAAAAALRVAWKLGQHPVANLAELIEEHQIKVFPLKLEDGFSGMKGFVRRADGRSLPFIVVNANHGGERQRFTMAHELAHLVLDLKKAADAERACYRFAGALLVPAERLKREVGESRKEIIMQELFALKALFGVSAQTVAHRCAELKIVNRGARNTMFRLFETQGWRTLEPNPVPVDSPKRLKRLALRALIEERITFRRAAEFLETDYFTLLNSLDQAAPDVDVKPVRR